VAVLGKGSRVTRERELAGGEFVTDCGVATIGVAASGSDGAVVDAGRIHQTRTAASSTALMPSAISRRPDAWLHGARTLGAGDNNRCTTGTCRSRC